MGRLILHAFLLLALPAAVFIGGAWTTAHVAGRQRAIDQLREKADPRDRKPLNQRVTGYRLPDVQRHWGALDREALTVERRFLELDLVFPLFYGLCLGGALLVAWIALGRPFHAAWLGLPVVVTVLADWTENTVALAQLRLYMEKGSAGLQPAWIQVASIATVLKLVFFTGASLLLVYLVVSMVVRAVDS